MSDQNVIINQYNTYHITGTVQIGIGNILKKNQVDTKDREEKRTPASKNDNYDTSSDEGEYQMDNAEEEKTMEDMINLTISDEGEYQMDSVEEEDMINLTILYDEINIRVSRNQTVREVEAIIQEEYGRRYRPSHVDDYIYSIYSKKQNRLIYDSFNDNNKDLPLSFYGTENGDEVQWWSD